MANKSNVRNGLAISMFLLTMAGLAQAATITVGPGVGYDFETIQAGIDVSNDADTVLVAPGEYVITEPITYRGKAITVISGAGPDVTTIRMGTPADPKRGSVVAFENNETDASVLEGFTITGGSGSWLSSKNYWAGGGILFEASSGTVRNCAIVQNRPDNAGGGVMVYSGSSAILMNCIITGNSTRGGGSGVYCTTNSSVIVTDCIITGNSATGVTHFVDGYGAGVNCGGNSSMTITNCTITENSAGVGGGGVFCYQSSVTVTHCVITGNTSQQWGGGIDCVEGSVIVNNCVIARNTAISHGGGVFCVWPDTSVTLTNTIVWGNTAPTGPQINVGNPATFNVMYSNIVGGKAGIAVHGSGTLYWGEGNIDTNPLFAHLGYWDENGTRDPSDDVWVPGDYHLKSQAGRWEPATQAWIKDDVTSPCIDAGDPMSPIGWELFPNGGFVNMGAYGSTLEASKSYFGEPVCETIVAGDINGDGQVNRTDLEIMALHWTDDEPLPLP